MYLNKAIIVGNITHDPELRAMLSGINVCQFSVATNRVFRDRNGKKVEQADFHNIVVFGKQADTCSQRLKKGQLVFVEGRMQARSWEKDGAKRYRVEVVADRVQFEAQKEKNAPTTQEKEDVVSDISPDDIPF